MLHKNGVVMGREKDFYPPPIRENPKGFYENVRFRRVNDALLKKYNYRVKSFSTAIPEVWPQHFNGNLCGMAKDLIKEYNNEFPIWGWKDPRTGLTAPVWFDVLKRLHLIRSTRIILMRRGASAVSESMCRRGNKEQYQDHFEHLWLKYYNRMEFYLYYLGYDIEILELKFEYDLLRRTAETCDRLSEFLGHTITNHAHIEPSISKSGKERNARTNTSSDSL